MANKKGKKTNAFVLFGRAFKNARGDFWVYIHNISNGYCAGGRWIDAEHAMQRVAAAELILEKGENGQWMKTGDLTIQGRDRYIKDIALIAMPCHDDAKKRHITATYNAQGKGRNGAMQGPLSAPSGVFSGYGFSPLPDIGMLQVQLGRLQPCLCGLYPGS